MRSLKDGEKWLRCLNYVRYHKINAIIHEHPLDEIFRKAPCRICKKEPKNDNTTSYYPDGFSCMFCKEGEYEICSECQPQVEASPKDLLITTPHHPHKLMAFDSPRQLHPFDPLSNEDSGLPCNNCGKGIMGRMYYCPRCDYAECISCAPSSSGSDPAIGSAPMQLEVKNLKDYLKSDKPSHFKLSVKESQRMPQRNDPW